MLLRIFFVAMMAFGTIGVVVAGWIVLHPVSPQKTPPAIVHVASPPMATVLTAALDLDGGIILARKMVGSAALLASSRPKGALADTPENRRALSGALLKQPIGAGEPILSDDIISPEDRGFLAAVLTPGTVAETISINPETGVGGLIWPGDHVDVLLTMVNKDPDVPQDCRVAAMRVLGDIRVVAIDRHLTAGLGPGFDDRPVRTATLELEPGDVPRLTLATRLGDVSLVVRSALSGVQNTSAISPADWTTSTACAVPIEVRGKSVMWGSDLFPSAARQNVVHVFAGQSDEKDYAQ